MPSKIYAQPAVEPITLEEAKLHLRIENDDTHEDSLIYALIAAACRHCENFLGRALITQTWDFYADSFPLDGCSYLELPYPPLASVATVKYKDTAGTLQTWDAANYIVDTISEPGRIALAYGVLWPSTYDEIQAVQIRFVAGYGLAGSVPQQIKNAILLKLTDLYENRGDAERAFVTNTLEQAIEALLWSERIVPL
jgi:uncharacterized phiE125 gp8 family phage protein